MADYYSILDKTISGLPNNTPEIRNAVFKKARTAIETQLRNMNPTPSEDAISSQLKLLEEAILLIDSEYAPQITEPPVAELPSEPEPILQAETPQYEAPVQAEAPPANEPTPIENAPIEPAPMPEPIDTPTPAAPISVTENVVDRVESAIDKIQREVPPNVGLDVPSQASVQSDVGAVNVDPSTRDILDPIISAQSNEPAMADMDFDEKKSGGFFGGLVKLLVVLGVLGGAGYAIWKNKDELTSFVSGFMAPTQVVEETQTTENSEPVNEVQEEAPQPEPIPEPVVPEVTEPVTTEPEVAEPEVVEPETVVTEEATPEVAEPTTQENGVIPIGEVAYLYEEGSAGSGATRTNAAITWELRQESLSEGIAPEPVIIGKMDVPEKAMSIDIKIKRNIDEAVSASHMIELRFNTPADFTGKSVESIARFVMKTSEEAPGEPLVAVPVKVSDGFFLIALDNLPQAVALNTQLLKSSTWIDVPVVYGTGKRALITLEKGGTGERVFDEAFKDWENR